MFKRREYIQTNNIVGPFFWALCILLIFASVAVIVIYG